jgi:hypothetical protein
MITIRVSTLPGYPDCPRRGATRLFRQEIVQAGFRLRYLRRGIGAVIGTAVHRGVSVALAEKAKTGLLPPSNVTTDAGRDALQHQVEDGNVTYDGPNGQTHWRPRGGRPGRRDDRRLSRERRTQGPPDHRRGTARGRDRAGHNAQRPARSDLPRAQRGPRSQSG